MLTRLIRTAALIGTTCLCAGSVCAQGHSTLNSVDRGWYDATGFHNPANNNYVTGMLEIPYRSFFVFDRSEVLGSIRSVQLRLFLPDSGYNSADPTENLGFYQLNLTSLDSLIAGGVGRTALFDDLGDGPSFGSTQISEADEGRFVTLTLNETFEEYLDTVTGLFAFGAALTTADGDGTENVFAWTGSSSSTDGRVQLVITTDTGGLAAIPEPATYGFAGVALLLGFAVVRRLRGLRSAA